MPKSKSTSPIVAPNPALVAIKGEVTRLLKKAQDYKVTSTLQFEGAAVLTKSLVDVRRRLKALCDPEIKAAKLDYDTKRKAFKTVDDLIDQGEEALRSELEAYAQAQRAAREVQVEKALSAGKDEKAASLAAKPFVPEVSGLSFTEHWHAQVTNLRQFVYWCWNGTLDETLEKYLSANMVELNAKARDLKSEDLGIPGVRGVKETSSSIRT